MSKFEFDFPVCVFLSRAAAVVELLKSLSCLAPGSTNQSHKADPARISISPVGSRHKGKTKGLTFTTKSSKRLVLWPGFWCWCCFSGPRSCQSDVTVQRSIKLDNMDAQKLLSDNLVKFWGILSWFQKTFNVWKICCLWPCWLLSVYTQ